MVAPPTAPSPIPPRTAGFVPATKVQSWLRLALAGPSGAGKTWTSLKLATSFAQWIGTRVAVVDTERGAASKYADQFEFDVMELGPDPRAGVVEVADAFHPRRYREAIQLAVQAGYGVLVLDSITHEWAAVLELVDRAQAQARSRGGPGGNDRQGNKFAAWRDVTPEHDAFIQAMLGAPLHVIATMRSKQDYQMTTVDGRTKVQKLGLAPVQREGTEYEFDVVGELSADTVLTISKTRCSALAGAVLARPDATDERLASTLYSWITAGAPAASVPTADPRPQATTSAQPPAKRPRTMRDWWTDVYTVAVQEGLITDIPHLVDDTPDDWLREDGQQMKARIDELREARALQHPPNGAAPARSAPAQRRSH